MTDCTYCMYSTNLAPPPLLNSQKSLSWPPIDGDGVVLGILQRMAGVDVLTILSGMGGT